MQNRKWLKNIEIERRQGKILWIFWYKWEIGSVVWVVQEGWFYDK